MIGVDSEKIDQYIELASGVSSTAEVSTIEDPYSLGKYEYWIMIFCIK